MDLLQEVSWFWRRGQGFILLCLLVWLANVHICYGQTVDDVLAYFSDNPAGRQEFYVYAGDKLGAGQVSEGEKARVQNVLQSVGEIAGLSTADWLILVADNPKFNAYALPGYIFVVNRGALSLLTDAELQVVLCHELAHEVLGHPLAGLMRSSESMRCLRRAVRRKEAAPLAGAYWEALQMSVVLKREEKAADIWAAQHMAAYGFDMSIAVGLWDKLRREYGEVTYDSNHLTYRERSKIYRQNEKYR